MSEQIAISSYNIELSKRPDAIIKNVTDLSKTVGIFCLQEVMHVPGEEFILNRLCDTLEKNWRVEEYLGDQVTEPGILSHGVAVVWDSNRYEYQSTKKIALPKMAQLSWREKMIEQMLGFVGEPVQRRALSVHFRTEDNDLRVTSVHLDSMGGAAHRRAQTAYLLSELHQDSQIAQEIICGDFNTNSIMRRSEEVQQLHDIFAAYDFSEASRDVPWTVEIFNSDFGGKRPLITRTAEILHIRGKQKFDYIWSKGLVVHNSYRLDVDGSDHYPIVAGFGDKNE